MKQYEFRAFIRVWEMNELRARDAVDEMLETVNHHPDFSASLDDSEGIEVEEE